MDLYQENLFDLAKREICIVSGELETRSWDDPDAYLTALTIALNRGVEVKIICGPKIDGDSALLSYLKEEPRVQLYKLPSRPEKHYSMRDVDDKGSGVLIKEDRHEPFEMPKNIYYSILPRMMIEYFEKFRSLVAEATKTKIEDFEVFSKSL